MHMRVKNLAEDHSILIALKRLMIYFKGKMERQFCIWTASFIEWRHF